MHQEFESPSELKDTIECFWYDSRDYGETPSSFEVLPDGYAEIIFHFGSGCNLSKNGGLQSLPSPFMMGLLHQPVHFFSKNRLEIIGVRCFPWTVFDLLGLPAISVPCGFTKNGLPIGLQIAGGPWREDLVLQLAYAYEQASRWHEQVRQLASS